MVYALGTGLLLTLPDLLSHIEELAADPRYKAPMKKIVDYRNATIKKLAMKEYPPGLIPFSCLSYCI